ncbi:LOW QUALITY PROTEIN: TAF6-like RNA polymerase II p300/CBP-associated factor-associated factor 65 kDa subunit 6L [Eudromia elegans]
MAEREERRFAELPRDSVRLVAEAAGLELPEEAAALLAEDLCYRLREAAQNSAQFLKHTRRRRLAAEDFNRALRWSNVQAVCGHGCPEAPPPPRERHVDVAELALATNIPKGCAQAAVRVHVSYLDGKGNVEPQGAVPSAVAAPSAELLQYHELVTRAVLGDDPQLMKVALQDLRSNPRIAALLPYFVYVVSGVKSVSHDLEQLHRLLHVARSLLHNPYVCLGPYVRSLVASVTYCVLEPLAASINPRNDHWALRDAAALLLSRICWLHGDLVSGLHQQVLLALQKVLADPVRPLCSHYGAVVGLHALGCKAVERVLYPQLGAYWGGLQAVLDDYSVSNAQVKADGHKVYGAILVRRARGGRVHGGGGAPQSLSSSPPSPPVQVAVERLLKRKAAGGAGAAAVPLRDMYGQLYEFFGDSLAPRFGTGARPAAPARRPPGSPEAAAAAPGGTGEGGGAAAGPAGAPRKMPQLTASAAVSPREEGSPRAPARAAPPPRARAAPRPGGHRPGVRDAFPKGRPPPRPAPRFTFVIAGRQAGRRCRGRRFQTCFPQHLPPGHVSRYAQKLPVIGRAAPRPPRPWARAEYSLALLL